LHGVGEPAHDLPRVFDLPGRDGLGEVGDVEDRHGEPVMRRYGLW
jgi:hypothetical protein